MKIGNIFFAVVAANLWCAAIYAQHIAEAPKSADLELPSVIVEAAYESQYVSRAEKYSGHCIQPKVELSYPLCSAVGAFAGVWYSKPISESHVDGLSEFDAYGGLLYSRDSATLSVSYFYDFYPELENCTTRDMEIHIDVSFDTSKLFDVNLSPAACYVYNWITCQQIIEISSTYELPLGAILLDEPKLALSVKIYGGYLSSGRRQGDMLPTDEGVSYFYCGAYADLTYAIADFCSYSIGARCSHRGGGNSGEPCDHAELCGRESNLWFGSKITFNF